MHSIELGRDLPTDSRAFIRNNTWKCRMPLPLPHGEKRKGKWGEGRTMRYLLNKIKAKESAQQ